MKISARTDYALRAVIELAAAHPQRRSAPEIAEQQQIPRQFLDSVLGDLRRAGLVGSQRGVGGGFWLCRPGDEITLADVIQAADGPVTTVRGELPQDLAYEGTAVPLQKVWIAMRAGLTRLLESVTVADVARDQLPAEVIDTAASRSAWR